VAGLGLALTVLDAYALYEVAFADRSVAGYAAVASAALASVWAGYGFGLGARIRSAVPEAGGRPALRLPLPAAMAAAQSPLLLWTVAAGAGARTSAAALLVTAALDAAVALRVSVPPVRLVAAVGAYGSGAWGTLAAGVLLWQATGPGAAAPAAALLLLAAAMALVTARHVPGPDLATVLAVAGGLVTAGAFGGLLRSWLPDDWTVPGFLLCGIALAATVHTGLPEPMRRGLLLASAAVQALAVLWALPVSLVAVLGPVSRVAHIWSGVPADARAAVTLDLPWPGHAAAAPLVSAVVALVLAAAVRDPAWRDRARAGSLALAWATAFALPATLELPYAAALSVQALACVAVLAAAAYLRPSEPLLSPLPLVGLLLALIGSLSLALLSLASEAATLAVLAALSVLFAVAARQPRPGPVTVAASLTWVTALACAAGASSGWQPQHTALLVLAVPAGAALLAARVDGSPLTVPVEVTGAAAALLAVVLTVPDPTMLALLLALCGVIASGTAIRESRRGVGWAAAVLFVLAAWVRLASWDVGSPEAYTVPVTVPALILGAVRRRKDARVSSWTAYGAGLSATLVPSLVAAWADAHWPRPLLLCATALALTLVGARHRLRAPLVLGGAVLVLDALHELAPYIAQVADALPRWVPPALAGLVLLALGATYERRIRDARRVREVLGRMR
jgi:hypothetical protein